jgi:hypothetical protein
VGVGVGLGVGVGVEVHAGKEGQVEGAEGRSWRKVCVGRGREGHRDGQGKDFSERVWCVTVCPGMSWNVMECHGKSSFNVRWCGMGDVM